MGKRLRILDGQADCLSACLSEYFFRVRSKGVHVQDCPVSCTCSAFTLTRGILRAPSDYTMPYRRPSYCGSRAIAVKVSLLTLDPYQRTHSGISPLHPGTRSQHTPLPRLTQRDSPGNQLSQDEFTKQMCSHSCGLLFHALQASVGPTLIAMPALARHSSVVLAHSPPS